MKLQRLLGALCAGLMLISLPAKAVEQSTTVMPIAGPMSMATFAGKVNDAHRAMMSCSWGTSAPANGPSGAPIVYQCWADTTANPVLFKYYDGASWVTFGALNTSTHVWTPYRNGAAIVDVATSGSASDLSTGTLPAARLPNPTASSLGGIQSKTCSASQWLNDISTSGVPSCAQPNFTDLAGTAALAQLPAFSGMTAAAAAADADTFPTNQGAGNLKQTLAAIKTWIKAWIVKADVSLGNVDNTSDATKWAATKALTNTTFDCGGTGNVCTVRLASDITGFGTGVATALGVNIGSAGAPVLYNGAGGTPSALVGTNITGTASGLTAGNVTTNANLTGEVTSVGNATTVTNASVIAKLLTAFSAGAGTVSSTDSILSALQKIVGNLALKADIASPTFTGVPAAPTASPSNNSTQLATTAYVDAQVAAGVSGVASVGGQTGALSISFGQARLSKSGSNLILLPYRGNLLTVNGVNATVPDAGITLAATSLTAGTLYYIYATQSGGAINALEASTTGHSISTTAGNKGVEIKTGDDARTFVGWAVPDTGPAWVNSTTKQYVRSYFNDEGVLGVNFFASDVTYSTNSWAELSSSARVDFISRGEVFRASVSGMNYHTSASGKLMGTSVGVDGATPQEGPSVVGSVSTTSTNWLPVAGSWAISVSEGVHYITMLGRSYDAVTITWKGGASGAANTALFVTSNRGG